MAFTSECQILLEIEAPAHFYEDLGVTPGAISHRIAPGAHPRPGWPRGATGWARLTRSCDENQKLVKLETDCASSSSKKLTSWLNSQEDSSYGETLAAFSRARITRMSPLIERPLISTSASPPSREPLMSRSEDVSPLMD
jgi:hypothetical protein